MISMILILLGLASLAIFIAFYFKSKKMKAPHSREAQSNKKVPEVRTRETKEY